MATVSTGSLHRSLWPGVNKFTGLSYAETSHQYKEIFEVLDSSKNYELDVTMGQMGLATVKPEGQSIQYDDFAQGFDVTYRHVTYGDGFIITREAIEDNQYMELSEARSKLLGKTMKETKENVCANVLNRAFNSGYLGADGLELCSTAHLLEKGGTYRNELTTAADMSEASLEQAAIDIMDFRDGANKIIAARPMKLIIPRALCFEVERILKSTLQNDSANNAINALKSKGVLPQGYVVNHYLTDTDAWFIKTDVPEGLKLFQRRPMKVDTDSDFDSENLKFKATERYSVGWTDPRGVFGSPGA